jgi:hypothetical protein
VFGLNFKRLFNKLLTVDEVDEIPTEAAVNVACHAVCRSILEDFAKAFVGKHAKMKKLCSHHLDLQSTVTDILKHFEVCPGVTNDAKLILGDDMSGELSASGIQLPTSGSFAKIYSALSQNNWKIIIYL